MKNTIFATIILVLGFAGKSFAQNLEAKPLDLLVQQLESSKFTFKESGLAQGFFSIHSCLYISEEFAVLKNYCVPKKKYPAKGYTIFSKKFGIIDLYQEQLTGVIQRDVRISVFPENLYQVMKSPTSSYRIKSLNAVSEHFYKLRGPACWSTNFSRYTEQAEYQCNVGLDTVSGFFDWAEETQALAGNEAQWNALFNKLERIFPK